MSALPVLTTPRATSAYFNISSRASSRAPISPRDFNREMSKTYHPLKKKVIRSKIRFSNERTLEEKVSDCPLSSPSVHRTPQDIFFPTIYFKREIRRAGGDPGSRGIDVYTVFPLEIKQKKKGKKKKKRKNHTHGGKTIRINYIRASCQLGRRY